MSGGLESLQRAVAQYKMAGDWDTAAATTTRMAEILRKQGAVIILIKEYFLHMLVHNYIPLSRQVT